MAFVDNPNNYDVVDHINRVRTDNRLENLRWTTIRENNKNKTGNGDFIDDLPDNCIEFKKYNGHEF